MADIFTQVVGFMGTNCYILTDGKIGIVVDPGADYLKIAAKLKEIGVKADAVLLTHGHFDHISALPELKACGAKVYIHEKDVKMLSGEWSLADELGSPIEPVCPDVILLGGETLNFGEISIKVIHTPGHTQGSCCYDVDGRYLLSGDTLFYCSYGRTDFPGGSEARLVDSIRALFEMDDRIVYPGHGQSTTLGFERDFNPIAMYL